jgi:ferritin-like protein
MAGASEGIHEPLSELRPETLERHRAIVSLIEELEAVDWYDQRCDAAKDDELRAILAHNRDEEKEHAAMLLEWLRRHDATLDEELKTYLYSKGSILAAEEQSEEGTAADNPPDESLGIGGLRQGEQE